MIAAQDRLLGSDSDVHEFVFCGDRQPSISQESRYVLDHNAVNWYDEPFWCSIPLLRCCCDLIQREGHL